MNDRLQVVPATPFAFAPKPGAGVNRAEQHKSITYYWSILFRYKWFFLVFALLGTAIGLYRYLTAVPIYEARLTMIIEPERANTTADAPIMSWYVFSRFYETQYQVIKSRVVAERVVDRLELIKQPTETMDDVIVQPSLFARLKATIAGFVTDVKRGQQTNKSSEARAFDRRSQLADSIKNGLGVNGGDNSQLVELSLRSADAQYAADVVNTVAQEYIALGIENRSQKTRSAGQWLTLQIEDLRQKVVDSEANLKAYQAKEGIINLESLNELTNSQLVALNQTVVNAQERYNELAKRYGSKHPRLIAAGGELAEARARLNSASKSSVASQEQRFELARLEQEVNTNRDLYESFLAKFNQADFTTDEKLANAHVLDLARPSEYPVAPDKKKLLSTWTLLGFVLGLVMVAVREHIDNTFATHREVEKALDLPALGLLPLLTGSTVSTIRRRLRTMDEIEIIPEKFYMTGAGSPFVESINHIRTSVLYSDVDQPPKTIVVTSSIQGEGKTTLAMNLALAFGQLDKTLLLDADLRKPRAGMLAGSNESVGLVDYVAVRCDLQDCILKYEGSNNLSVLRTGTIPPNPLEMLSSKRFARAVEGLKGRFNHIVIDVPPVLPVSDAIVLGRLADATIMVVEAHRTTQATAIEAVERLRASNVLPLGVVLSKVDQRKQGYYYYGQYNDYGGYYREDDKLPV